ncbi:PepSY domain-containing protein [Thiohalomonas denitrificans]|uniref:PepSY domain-containing protein n=1 Tax=Thiohalomonas denitrificans TaxID=415747 RepID=UPI0026EC9969|nr:hypothetical protein [Thiohalomonas denitrificans]
MKRLTAALLLFLALGAHTSLAAPSGYNQSNLTMAQASGMALDQAAAQVRRETGGRILSAETVREKGRKVHRIKVLTPDRKVRIVRIEANGR